MLETAGRRLASHLRHLTASSPALMATAAGPTDRPDVYIVGVARTPHGAFQGGLAHLSAPELGSIAIKGALERAGVQPGEVSEVFMGNVISSNVGQAPARQASLRAGLPLSTDCTTVNKVCSSGMKAIALGAQSIICGLNDVVVAGGMESMSQVPYYEPTARAGARLGHVQLVDGLVKDGLWDAFHDIHMGECAEMCAEKHGISREQQDVHAVESVARARAAIEAGVAAWEIVPVEVPGARGAAPSLLSSDEPVAKMNPEKLRKLKPFFRPSGGTVTAGNASPITDGAAAVVLASGAAVQRLGLTPLARVLGFADAALDPRDFPTAPALAIPKALQRAGLSQEQVEFWEINEAFSVVDLANQKLLKLDPAKVNVLGGAVAIGHPIGASGARLVVTLLNVLRQKGGRTGVAAICNGGGGASSIVVERLG